MAFGIDDLIANGLALINTGINKIWPNPDEKAKADALVIRATAEAALESMRQQMSVMLAEAQSTDKWTSRARPSFLYVMYIMILIAIPFAVLWAFSPDVAQRMTTGLRLWLAAIPDGLWATFGLGYSGYAIARSVEKKAGVAK